MKTIALDRIRRALREYGVEFTEEKVDVWEVVENPYSLPDDEYLQMRRFGYASNSRSYRRVENGGILLTFSLGHEYENYTTEIPLLFKLTGAYVTDYPSSRGNAYRPTKDSHSYAGGYTSVRRSVDYLIKRIVAGNDTAIAAAKAEKEERYRLQAEEVAQRKAMIEAEKLAASNELDRVLVAFGAEAARARIIELVGKL